MRICCQEQCGTDISDRDIRARWCVPCAEEKQREHNLKWREANPEYDRKRYANREKGPSRG